MLLKEEEMVQASGVFFLGGGSFFFPLAICLGLMNSIVFSQLLEH